MKKIFLLLCCFIMISPLIFFAGCDKDESLTKYELNITYFPDSQTADCAAVINYINNSSNSLKEVKFHLYPNAFSEGEERRVSTSATEDKVYPNGISYGGIQIDSVKQKGEETTFDISQDKLILSVPLEKELFPDEQVKFEIKLSLTLPNALHRFGYSQNSVNFANFYPIACVYEEGDGFKQDPYVSNGDPFFSDIANYFVTVSYPPSFVIACSGDKFSSKQNGEFLTSTFEAKKVRDVCFVLSEKFQRLSAKAGKVDVEYFYYSDQDPQLSLDVGVNAVQFYSDKFGQYPYSSLAIVQTGFVQGGMEYPRLVMISDSVAAEDYPYVIAHEIAHQWWYGVVGNDQFNQPWLDESLTEYSAVLFFENHPKYNLSYSQLVDGAMATYNHFLDIYSSVIGNVDTSMSRNLTQFATEPEYAHNIYTRGIIMFDSLRGEIGEKKLYAALKGYYKQFMYKNVSTDEFIDFFSQKAGRNLQPFFSSWLDGKVKFVTV